MTCNPTELSSCVGAITSNTPPSKLCCSKIKEQKPCLCTTTVCSTTRPTRLGLSSNTSSTPSSSSSSSSSSSATAAAIAGVKESSAMQKRFQRLSRNVSEAIASLKNSLNLDSARDSPPPPQSRIESCRKVVWGSVVRNLTQLYLGSQLPEKLVSNIRKHYDSLPLSYAQAGFDMKDVFMHIKLIEQASEDDQPAILIQEVSDDEVQGSVFKLTFACNSAISWAAMSGALDSASICCKKIQIFEKTSVPLNIAGVALMSFPVLNSHLRLRFETVDGLILDSPWACLWLYISPPWFNQSPEFEPAVRLRVCRQKMHKKSNKRFFLLQVCVGDSCGI
ncbi:unnamed protein product [Camellia sinensis]